MSAMIESLVERKREKRRERERECVCVCVGGRERKGKRREIEKSICRTHREKWRKKDCSLDALGELHGSSHMKNYIHTDKKKMKDEET